MPRPAFTPTDPGLTRTIDVSSPSVEEQEAVARALVSPYALAEAEQRYVFAVISGMPHEDSLYHAGLPQTSDVHTRERVQTALAYLRQKQLEMSNITRTQLTEMFMTAFHCAMTATEMVQATREIGLLNDLYPIRKSVSIPLKGKGQPGEDKEQRLKRLSRMTDAELLEMVDMDLEPAPIEGEILQEAPNEGE